MGNLSDLYSLSDLELTNRIIMAPKRNPRVWSECPNEETATYHAQQASAGLIISEGMVISPKARDIYGHPASIQSVKLLAGSRLLIRFIKLVAVFLPNFDTLATSPTYHCSLTSDCQFPVSAQDHSAGQYLP